MKRTGKTLEEIKQNKKILCSTKGLLWWNNGEKNTRSKVWPGKGWINGKLSHYKSCSNVENLQK